MDLGSVLPREALVEPKGRYMADLMGRGVQGTAEAVVLPSTTEEVAAVMRWCYEHDVPLTTRGGGSGYGKPLPARRAIGDHPHRIDRLMRRSGSDEDMESLQILLVTGMMRSRITCGSDRRPGPNSPHAISPSSGSITWTPSLFNCATLRCVAAC